MNQADVTKLVSKLRFNVHKRRRLTNPDGSQGRHDKIRKTVTALLKYERIELNYHRGDECRGYAERLISDAIRYGDCHKETMEMADYWIIEKQIIHKLFKVLAPRFRDSPVSYTKMWRSPRGHAGFDFDKCVLELRGNIYPPLGDADRETNNRNLIHNILLDEAKREFRRAKYAEIAENLSPPQLHNNDGVIVDKVTDNLKDVSVSEAKKAMPPTQPKVQDISSVDVEQPTATGQTKLQDTEKTTSNAEAQLDDVSATHKTSSTQEANSKQDISVKDTEKTPPTEEVMSTTQVKETSPPEQTKPLT